MLDPGAPALRKEFAFIRCTTVTLPEFGYSLSLCTWPRVVPLRRAATSQCSQPRPNVLLKGQDARTEPRSCAVQIQTPEVCAIHCITCAQPTLQTAQTFQIRKQANINNTFAMRLARSLSLRRVLLACCTVLVATGACSASADEGALYRHRRDTMRIIGAAPALPGQRGLPSCRHMPDGIWRT